MQPISLSELDSFIFVLAFIIIYFILFLGLYFAEIGLDVIRLWKLLSNLGLVSLFFTILLIFFGSILYYALPFYLLILTLNIVLIYNWKGERNEILSQIGLILSSFMSVLWTILLFAYGLGLFEGIVGGEFLGISPNEGPTFNRLFGTILSPVLRQFQLEELLFLGVLFFISIVGFIKFITNAYASYTYLQGRPSSVPHIIFGSATLILFLFTYLKFPTIFIIITAGLITLLTLFSSLLSYSRSKHVFYLLMFVSETYITILMIFIFILGANIFLIFIAYIIIADITLITIPDQEIIEMQLE